jgi:hypothetical protein
MENSAFVAAGLLYPVIQKIESIHNFRDWCCHLYSCCSRAMEQYMIVLAHPGSQCSKFMQLGRCADFYALLFGIVYLT